MSTQRKLQYAIKVPFEDGWQYVTEGDSFNLKPKLYDDLNLAISDRLSLCGPRSQVVEYNEEQN